MTSMLRDLVAHKGYANAAVLSAIASSPMAREDADVAALLHHVLVSNRFWARTVAGLPFDAAAELASPRDFAVLLAGFRDVQALEDTWLAAATDTDLGGDVAGPLVPGGRCTAAQALTQVCLHSLGHRAQCASLLRRHAVTPPTTDFIVWLVDRPAATWPTAPAQ